MHWIVQSTLVCPYTGTAFSSILTLRNLRLIIWYNPQVLLRPGDIIEPFRKGFMVNGEYFLLTVFKVHPYNRKWWVSLNARLQCPGNKIPQKGCCSFPQICFFNNCPWGLRKNMKP